MTRFPAASLAAASALLLAHGTTSAEGVRYQWASPGVHFGAPVAISDRDESPRSGSTIRLTYPRAELPDGRSTAALRMEFHVAENAALGYSYGGFAIPFPSPIETIEGGEIAFLVRSESGVSSFQVVLRDEQLRRSTHTFEVEAGEEWAPVRIPLRDFDPPVAAGLESIAFVVIGAESGILRLADLWLPVQTETVALSAVSRMQLRPKWYTHAGMAELVAQHLETPLLIITSSNRGDGVRIARALEHDESWKALLSQTTNLLLTESDSAAPSLALRGTNGEALEGLDPGDPAAPGAIAAALAAWEKN